MMDLKVSPILMGIVNITPDSFSDSGQFLDVKAASEHALRLYQEGADILDLGGESTRPGSVPVSPQEEQNRVLPVLEAIKSTSDAYVSVDTYHASTMKHAIKAGADMINDVTALTGDTESLSVIKDSKVSVCLMHMKGTPKSMQDAPIYDNVVEEVYGYLEGRIDACLQAGVTRERIVVDPGIGFGKTLKHNLALLKNLDFFKKLNVSIMLGSSRKSFIQKIDKHAEVDKRLPGSLASVLWGYEKGVNIFRVHDVAETKQALDVYRAIKSSA